MTDQALFDILQNKLVDDSSRIKELEKHIADLESRTGLLSSSFVRRVYTALGYVILALLWIAAIAIFLLATGAFFLGLLGT